MVAWKDEKGVAHRTALFKPGKPAYEQQLGGLFWVVKHDAGVYMLEASKLLEYVEATPTPGSGGGRAETIQAETY